MSKGFKVFLSVIVFLLFVFCIYKFIATPKEIVGNDVGKYKDRQIVLFMSRDLHEIFGQLEVDSVITFKRSDMAMEGVAVVAGLPGKSLDQKIYYISNEEIGNTIPVGYYAVKFGDNQYLRAISEEDISGVAWFPF